MKRYSGREFTPEELRQIVERIERVPGVTRAALSRWFCERFDWRRPDGRLREMSCRVAMLRMQADGLIVLPASRMIGPRKRAHFAPTEATDPQPAITNPVHELGVLRLEIVQGGGAVSRVWNEYVARYHYLGYTPMSGSQIRYNVYAGDRLVALISFGASAWKLADREREEEHIEPAHAAGERHLALPAAARLRRRIEAVTHPPDHRIFTRVRHQAS
jgi:hypothetical protein